MATAVDWTVEKLLSQFQTLNARAESAQNTIRANRARYMEVLRSLPSIPDVNAREELRSRLRAWIYNQVAVENRFNELSAKWSQAKSMVKGFLQSVGVTPPAYLGFVVAVPVAVTALVVAGLALVAIIISQNTTQSKGINTLADISRAAAQNGWTAAETTQALRAASDALDTTNPDLLGIKGILESALPIVLVVGALMIFAPMMRKRAA